VNCSVSITLKAIKVFNSRDSSSGLTEAGDGQQFNVEIARGLIRSPLKQFTMIKTSVGESKEIPIDLAFSLQT